MRRALLARILSLCIVTIAGLLAIAPAQAQTAMVGQAVPLCIAPAVPGMTPAAMFAGKVELDCDSVQTRFGPGDFWLRSGPRRARRRSPDPGREPVAEARHAVCPLCRRRDRRIDDR